MKLAIGDTSLENRNAYFIAEPLICYFYDQALILARCARNERLDCRQSLLEFSIRRRRDRLYRTERRPRLLGQGISLWVLLRGLTGFEIVFSVSGRV